MAPTYEAVTDELLNNPTNEHQSNSSCSQGTSSAQIGHFFKFNIFYTLLVTTTVASLLVAAEASSWSRGGQFYWLVKNNRASVQIVIQVVANMLGFIHFTAVCRMINYASRTRFSRQPISLDTLRAWTSFNLARIEWDLPMLWLLPLVAFVSLTLIPSALWAGAITPVITTTTIERSFTIQSWSNTSLIHNNLDPSMRTAAGVFAYSVGNTFSGRILADGAAAPGIFAGSNPHNKFDDSQFSFSTRSYGVGSTVALSDKSITEDEQAIAYKYQEVGYSTLVDCIYNMSNNIWIEYQGPHLYAVRGTLPDSEINAPEYVNYVGVDTNNIVALLASTASPVKNEYIGILVGLNYDHLNNTQCQFTFTPTVFDVSVDVIGRNISVHPAGSATEVKLDNNITSMVVKEFHIISNINTNFYTSLVGNLLNSSIDMWQMAHTDLGARESTLAGLEHAFMAIADDILMVQSSAQYVIGNFSQPAKAMTTVDTIRFGSANYIYATFVVNALVVLVFVAEAIRNRGWKKLTSFDILDPRALVVSSSLGGKTIAEAANRTDMRDRGRISIKLACYEGMVSIEHNDRTLKG